MYENGTPFAALIIVVLAALVAALLIVVALVVWLAEVMGSLLYPCLIVGLFFALLAIIVYRISLRDILVELHERVTVIYDVTKTLREAVEWGVRLLFPNREH